MGKKTFAGIGLAGLIGAATALWLVKKRKQKGESTPPKKAPQVPIDNPGDQSEFPSAPEEERNLG